MEILFLSHCVPNPPDKGEKIRAYHEISHLSREHSIHLACFARNEFEIAGALALRDRCASVHVELLRSRTALCRAAGRFALGECLTTSFYDKPQLHRLVDSLRTVSLAATVAYSSAMAQYAPHDVPLLLDMVDVDSEKWLEYGRLRTPGPLYALEGKRLRQLEARHAAAADCTVVSTPREEELLRRFSPHRTITVENGVDAEFFDPAQVDPAPELRGRRALVFTGTMDYYPNVEAVCRFSREIFGPLRRRQPRLEFFVVGRNPASPVRALAQCDGVTVTGAVPDVRVYLAGAEAVVAPLRIARGVQNKVLEGLAMGKCVLASAAVCQTFGKALPVGVVCCEAVADHEAALAGGIAADVRCAARRRFCWTANMRRFAAELHRIGDIRRDALGRAVRT